MPSPPPTAAVGPPPPPTAFAAAASISHDPVFAFAAPGPTDRPRLRRPESDLLPLPPQADLGLTLICGRLPHGAITYNSVDAIFRIVSTATMNDGSGCGLVFKVEDPIAHVQYGNGVFEMRIAEIVNGDYKVLLTALPFPTL